MQTFEPKHPLQETGSVKNLQKLSTFQVFKTFLKLGLTSFGGPVAHLAYFHNEFVVRQRRLTDSAYADLVALCQFLPGPASSQVGIGIGLSQAGLYGGLAAWCGFTLPSALALILFAYGLRAMDASVIHSGTLHGLKVVAVAVVAQAIYGMGKTLCPDTPRRIMAAMAAILIIIVPGVLAQMVLIALGGLAGLFFLQGERPSELEPHLFNLGKPKALFSLGLFFSLLLLLPLLAQSKIQSIAMVDSFYRTGSLVFGGGHVVLPLLQAEVVNTGWISKDLFLAGYGAAQAVPGPLFTFSAYLGTAQQIAPNGWPGGVICLLAIFLPSFLLLVGILPFWERLRKNLRIRSSLLGINSIVVGLLMGAFYDPVWSSGILSVGDFLLALTAFALLTLWRMPSWVVVGVTGMAAALISHLGFF
jgi:chromate transporter